MPSITFRSLCLGAILLPASAAWAQTTLERGEGLFKTRCVVCHGVNADGRSELARIMRPPPANLRMSKLDDAERTRIVRKGGEAVGRSSNMPVWETELNDEEIRSVVAYVGTLKVHR
jgi:cytochrome c oxidase cbb3-type subunit 3